MTGKAFDYQDHFPGSRAVSRCSRSATLGNAIVLTKSAGRVGSAADIETLMADCASQSVDAIESRDRAD